MTQEELMNFCLKILGFYGFHPIKRHLFNTILKILQLASSCIVMGLLITEFVVNREKFSVEAYCKCAETFVTVLQVIIKVYTLEKYKEQMMELLIERSNFWVVENISDKLINEANAIYSYCLNTTKVFGYIAVAVVISYAYLGIVKRETFLSTYIPQNTFLTSNVIICIQIYFIVGGALIVLCSDGLFMAFCAKLIGQFKIITHNFENVVEIEDRDFQLKKSIQHHLFLSEHLQKLIDVYSEYFIVQYFIALLSIGVHMFMFLDDESTVQQMAVAGFYGIAVLIQLGGCYCIPSEAVHTQLLDLAQAIYNSQWYTTDAKFSRKLLLVLVASQKEKVFSAAGISAINREAFTNIFRASMSMFMFIRTIKEK